jgi:hypothetical protein
MNIKNICLIFALTVFTSMEPINFKDSINWVKEKLANGIQNIKNKFNSLKTTIKENPKKSIALLLAAGASGYASGYALGTSTAARYIKPSTSNPVGNPITNKEQSNNEDENKGGGGGHETTGEESEKETNATETSWFKKYPEAATTLGLGIAAIIGGAKSQGSRKAVVEYFSKLRNNWSPKIKFFREKPQFIKDKKEAEDFYKNINYYKEKPEFLRNKKQAENYYNSVKKSKEYGDQYTENLKRRTPKEWEDNFTKALEKNKSKYPDTW